MAEPEDIRPYIFDDIALEHSLTEGTEDNHRVIAECEEGMLFITRDTKDNFLDAYPEDKERLSKFKLMRKQLTDVKLAASFADKFQNFPDINSSEVQEKIYLLATAYRCNGVVVTGEYMSTTTRIRYLAEQLGIECITIEKFFELQTHS